MFACVHVYGTVNFVKYDVGYHSLGVECSEEIGDVGGISQCVESEL